jgi:hypothetical protein
MLILLLICHIISFLVLLGYFYKQFDSKLSAILLANLFGFLVGVISFSIIATFFAYDATSTITRPVKPTVRLVTATQVLKPGDHIKSVDSEGYLTTSNATKKVNVTVKGDGDTIASISYAEQHTNKKIFGLTLQKDSEKPKAIAIINTKQANNSLKHFFD